MSHKPRVTGGDGFSRRHSAEAEASALQTITTPVNDGKELFYVARDRRFLVNVVVDAEATPPIAIVLNWDAPFRK